MSRGCHLACGVSWHTQTKTMRLDPPLADSLPDAADFMIAVLTSSERQPETPLSWIDINQLAARWLRPQADSAQADTSRAGHAVVVEMARHNLVDAELTTASDGSVMVRQMTPVAPQAESQRIAA